jgi:hypothetical protein
MIALRLFITLVLRIMRRALPVRHAPVATTPSVCTECQDSKGAPSREPPMATKWDVVMYAIDSTPRTVRLCVIITVTVLAALFVLRLGSRLDIEFLFRQGCRHGQ